MKDRKAYIYQIKNKMNDKIYIGSTCNCYKRWYQHKYELNNNKHGNIHLQAAWNKYGQDNFEFSVLEEVPYQIQFQKEQDYLNRFNPFGDNGYNMNRKSIKNGESPHYIIKSCQLCGRPYETYQENTKYCDECRIVTSDDYFISLNKSIPTREDMNRLFEDCIVGCGYDSMDDFWECNGI